MVFISNSKIKYAIHPLLKLISINEKIKNFKQVNMQIQSDLMFTQIVT